MQTNAAFLERVLAHPRFMAGELDTHFLQEHRAELAAPEPDEELLARLIAVVALAVPHQPTGVPEPYRTIGHWRN